MGVRQQGPYKLFMRDTTGVDERVFDGLDTRYPLSGRGVPNELCSPFDFCASRVSVGPKTGPETRSRIVRPTHLEALA